MLSPHIQVPAAVGSVPYLNSRPLTQAIASPIEYMVPRILSEQLAAGKLDVALVPVMEVLDHPENYVVVDAVAIGSLHEVFSVYARLNVPLAQIKSVSLDNDSRTSVQLARVIFEQFHGLAPTYIPSIDPDASSADAVVLIGDPAISQRLAQPDATYLDLAAEWNRQTGLPFVFAVWAIRREIAATRMEEIAHQLRNAAQVGIAECAVIAKNEFELRYLTHHLNYLLDTPQKKAIQEFGQRVLQRVPKIEYV